MIRLSPDHEARKAEPLLLRQQLQGLIPKLTLVVDVWQVPSGISILAPTPAKAATILQYKDAIALRFGNATVERHKIWTTFILGPIPKLITILDDTELSPHYVCTWSTRPRALTYMRKTQEIRPYQESMDLFRDLLQLMVIIKSGRKLRVWNLYNAPPSSTGAGNSLSMLLNSNNNQFFVGGDFNLKNPSWDSITAYTSPQSLELINWANQKNVSLLNPIGVPTHWAGGTIDLAFCSQIVATCKILKNTNQSYGIQKDPNCGGTTFKREHGILLGGEVYDAEIFSATMALRVALSARQNNEMIFFLLDNQAAVMALQTRKSSSSIRLAYLFPNLAKTTNAVFRWVPGHSNI
ncbi:hypothetical protein EPUL_003235 [Erysiphe pulchra]|uniref:Endonuclease/exonuclease/phosphatase domain-containing protein n=1 Tax=Erysiphe pulchra TaxID=225359 RepID=A0A2S4PQ27_9PEZI|nr:hypothetical protein EPUL_003235 [Erysiphe pulchra]